MSLFGFIDAVQVQHRHPRSSPRNTRQMDRAPPSPWFYGTSNYAYKPHEYKAQHAEPLYWQEVSWPDAITSTWVDLACNLGYIWEVKVKVQLHPQLPAAHQSNAVMKQCEAWKDDVMFERHHRRAGQRMVLTEIWVGIGNPAPIGLKTRLWD